MIVEEVPGKAYHCGQLARTMRAEHRAAMSDVPTHMELRDVFDGSTLVTAWLFDHRLVGMAGISGTSIASAEANVWCALTDEAMRHPMIVARRALRFLKNAMRTKRRLATFVLDADRRSLDFAMFLGFVTKDRQQVKGVKARLMTYVLREVA